MQLLPKTIPKKREESIISGFEALLFAYVTLSKNPPKKIKKLSKKLLQYKKTCVIIIPVVTNDTTKYGSLVKRLRHRPFTAVTRVRFS